MQQAPALAGDGIVFSVYSSLGATDATQLWLEATEILSGLNDTNGMSAPTAFLVDTRLGRLCTRLFALRGAVGLALVDGGVEEVFEGSARRCLDQIAVDVRRPWDQSPNRLYVSRGVLDPSSED